MIRCAWAETNDLERAYHDTEWGKPTYDDDTLFEFLILEMMQAGLSWDGILKKRENFREAFDHFDYKKIAEYDQAKVGELLQNAGIIRNKLKINSAISNAKVFMEIQEEFGSFSKFIWAYVDYKPIVNSWDCMSDVPAYTELSDQMTKDLKKRGFKFLGRTIMYAYMQAIGMVDDHTNDCFCKNKEA